MADIRIMKAVEFSKLSAKFKKIYADEVALWAAGWVIQPKYDGCYGEFHVVTETSGVKSCFGLTRTGEIIKSCEHVIEAILSNPLVPSNCIIAGELWCDKDDVLFPEISGWVRRHYAAPLLSFMVFDITGIDRTGPVYAKRYSAYHAIFRHLWTSGVIQPVVNIIIEPDGFVSPRVVASNLKATGKYDGAILRDPCSSYKVGLVKHGEIVKVKPVLSLDLMVTNVFNEPGAKTGRPVYSIEVDYKGIKSRVGSGIPHDKKDVPDMGQIVEVECMGLTEDGKLREPRFKGIRFDKEQPDV